MGVSNLPFIELRNPLNPYRSFRLLGTSPRALMVSCACPHENQVMSIFYRCITGSRQVVTERSIMSLKKRALRRTRTVRADTESQTSHGRSWFSSLIWKLKAPFRRTFWEDLFERTDNETLVDAKLLSYAYIEAGLIETFARYVLGLVFPLRSLLSG